MKNKQYVFFALLFVIFATWTYAYSQENSAIQCQKAEYPDNFDSLAAEILIERHSDEWYDSKCIRMRITIQIGESELSSQIVGIEDWANLNKDESTEIVQAVMDDPRMIAFLETRRKLLWQGYLIGQWSNYHNIAFEKIR